MGQEAIFLESEGDAWHVRNKDKPYNNDRNEIIATIVPKVKSVLEVGCGDGRYLSGLGDLYGAKCTGIDISCAAIDSGRKLFPETDFILGSAQYRYLETEYEMVIYGFCLYVCDPASLHHIAHLGDRSLQDGGHLVIHDFDPEYPHKVPYHHVPGLFSYKMDYSKLWLANPAYSLVSKTVIGDGTAVWVLKKDVAAGWPEENMP